MYDGCSIDGVSIRQLVDAGGITGPEGPQGPQGEPGPKGDTGARGADGLPGADGARGADGAPGPQGERGYQGDPGPAGADSTVPGPAGAKGDKGDKGDTGDQGEQGLQGIPGAKGDKGDTGDQGLQGIQGVPGADSTVPGPAGADGADGVDGVSNYTLSVQALTSSPTDGQTVYFGNLPKAPTTTANTSRVYIPKAGTIKRADIWCYSGTAGTNENWSLYIRLNNTSDTLILTLGANTNARRFYNESLSISVIAGDYIEIKSVQPTWATNPATTIYGGYLYIE